MSKYRIDWKKMKYNNRSKSKAVLGERRGAAVVEAALILPLLIMITFGAIDISQYINLGQLVANASREGASVASHNGTETVAEVEEAVFDFMADAYPQLPESVLAEALDIEVRTGIDDAQVPQGDLTEIPPGDAISVRISFDFTFVRWIGGPSYWNGNVKETETFCRRE